MSTPLLELRDVVVRAAGRTILDVGALELPAASTMAVLGPNGAGKSTLLRVAAALLAPTSGEVLLDGRRASRPEFRELVAAVLQRPLLRRGSVRANVETGMRFRRLPRDVIRRRSLEWLDRLGIAGLADRPAHSLSGGEAQRVSLARALAVEPRLVVLDEPFSALDAPTRGELLADLRTALDETATAALLVTHDRDEAAALADSIAVLHAGELRQHGRTADVLENPADRDCARTLGFDTILPPLLAERLLGRATGDVALRASDCEVRDSDGNDAVAARLLRVVPFGPASRVFATIDGHPVQATAEVPAPPWLAAKAPGEPLLLRVRPGAGRTIGSGDERR